mgnify:CR=1 FL=1
MISEQFWTKTSFGKTKSPNEASRLLFEILVCTALTKRFCEYTLRGQHSVTNGATGFKKKLEILKQNYMSQNIFFGKQTICAILRNF